VGAVKRGEKLFVPHGDDMLATGDTILLLQQRRNRQATRSFFLESAAPAAGEPAAPRVASA
jgi:Trk K+ transport system NAD-binding subunit